MSSNLGICYEGIQRIYRNGVVRHIRETLTRAYPHDFQSKVRKPFEREWDKMQISALERRQSGELSAEVLDDFDLLSVNHFFNLFDAYYEVLCPLNGKIEDQQTKTSKQALLRWVKTIKDLRDPLSHPSEQDVSFEDSFVLLDCARRVLGCLRLTDEANRVKALTDNLLGRPFSSRLEREPLEDRLPPRESIVVDFVGRKNELKLLWEWFRDPISRRWALAGEGGKGKSTIAFSFATDVKFSAPEPYQLVLWLSAKRRRFQEGAAVEIARPDFGNLDGALSRILSQYGWLEEVELPAERKRLRVLELLNTFPALMVVDDIDSLEAEDEDAIEFFALAVPETKTKVLFTSRRVVFGMGKTTTHVGGFDHLDAEKFIFSRCRLLELDPLLLTKSLISEIIKVTEASPLYIEDLFAFDGGYPSTGMYQNVEGKSRRRSANVCVGERARATVDEGFRSFGGRLRERWADIIS
jgi:hypothetical protein